MAHETPPGTAPATSVLFSNDAQTLLEVVCPANPLPVTATFTPSGTQDENLKQVNGATVNVGPGASSTGTQRVTTSTDSTIGTVTAVTAITNALPAGSNVIGHVVTDTGSVSSVTPVKSTTLTASQVTVPATANGILILAANANRLGATISNPGSVTVYIQQGASGVTTSNGFGIPPGSSYNIDSPLYTGAIYGIVSASTQVVTVVELT